MSKAQHFSLHHKLKIRSVLDSHREVVGFFYAVHKSCFHLPPFRPRPNPVSQCPLPFAYSERLHLHTHTHTHIDTQHIYLAPFEFQFIFKLEYSGSLGDASCAASIILTRSDPCGKNLDGGYCFDLQMRYETCTQLKINGMFFHYIVVNFLGVIQFECKCNTLLNLIIYNIF